LSEESIKEVLNEFGLTNREAEIYIFLAKYGVHKGGEISKQTKLPKALVYRVLKRLERKGVVEATLESPTRFTAVPFEAVLEMNIKAKREEAALIEKRKNSLLEDWKNISRTELEPELSKLVVIEGTRKIYRKFAEIVENTKKSLSAAASIADLARAERFGVVDLINAKHMKSRVKFRLLTELSGQNLKAFKLLRTELNAGLDTKARNPDLSLAFPRMLIRDGEEILFFISPRTQSTGKREACILTNCGSFVQAFSGVFEELWQNSTSIEEKIVEIETGKPTPKTLILTDEERAKEKYVQTLFAAEEEIIMIISAKSLVQVGEGLLPFKKLAKRNISVKIMAPITTENLECAKLLSKHCEVRHTAFGCFETTIVDGKHLFRFKRALLDQEESGIGFSFKNAFYTNELPYIEKTRNMLENVWRTAYNLSEAKMNPIKRSSVDSKRRLGSKRDLKTISEQFLSAGRKHGSIMSGVCGTIEITPPSYLKMPNLKITAIDIDEDSSLGGGERLQVDLWLETPKGEAWVPVAIVLNASPKVVALEKTKWAGTLAGQNILVVKPDELQVWEEGTTLFAGWTIPIPLLGGKYKLDPACMLFEAFGNELYSKFSNPLPSGCQMEMEWNGFSAFTTYIGPSWKYSGPGTSGLIGNLIVVDTGPKTS
jgi:sugar-specific transcriptional regulator TrmB